jgi:nitrate reductase assembly molybdenum cofactor insertion protein NarJ
MSAIAIDQRLNDLLREAATWRLLSRMFECPDETWQADLDTLARELGDSDLLEAVSLAASVATEGQYHSTFGVGGPAPPREASYHETLELGSLMSEVAVYYQVFGYRPQLAEAPDHVAVEAGFVAYLKFKEAYALARGEPEHAEAAALAARRFIADHLAMLATPLADILASSHLDYLARASRALAGRVGPRPARMRLPMLQTTSDDDESGFECAASSGA